MGVGVGDGVGKVVGERGIGKKKKYGLIPPFHVKSPVDWGDRFLRLYIILLTQNAIRDQDVAKRSC